MGQPAAFPDQTISSLTNWTRQQLGIRVAGPAKDSGVATETTEGCSGVRSCANHPRPYGLGFN